MLQTAPPRRQLLIDVSCIAKHDARTGIQRVVRAVVRALQELGAASFSVRLVAAARTTAFRYLPNDWLEIEHEHRVPDLEDLPEAAPESGDMFLALDLNCAILPRHERTLAQWRSQGVGIAVVLYDLLPVTAARWFSRRMRNNIRRWLGVVERRADRVVAISESVAKDFAAWRARPRLRRARPIAVSRIALGSNLAASLPTLGMPDDAPEILDWVRSRPTVLMVGTVEPRKGHQQALAAFERLWRDFPDSPQMLVIGRAGWKTARLQREMRNLPSNEARFLWLESVSDQFLEEIYGNVAGLLAASEAEGFGLPLVEALAHGRPVLARDIAVFREIDGPGLTFFADDSAESLSESIRRWLAAARDEGASRASMRTWRETAMDLVHSLELEPETSEHRLPSRVRSGDLRLAS